MKSGSPGYIKGKPLLIGTSKDGSTPAIFEGVTYNLDGFALRGADNDGRCYYTKQAVSHGNENPTFGPDDLTVDSVDQKMYYDDPVLTFEDSMVYGCTLELNLDELDDFCSNNKWRNLMLF